MRIIAPHVIKRIKLAFGVLILILIQKIKILIISKENKTILI